MTAQQLLRNFWLSSSPGHLSPWEQAKALGLREASKELHGGQTNVPWICARLEKTGGGHPHRAALHEFFQKVDTDPEWFPGKHCGKPRGRKPLLTLKKRRCIARSAMEAKRRRRQEPCVAAVVEACPRATMNESTGQPFSANTIRKVFTKDCYDFDPEFPWKFQRPLQKVALPLVVREHRLAMAKHLLALEHSAAWWAQHVVWFDPCSTVLPGSQNQYDRMRQAWRGYKCYISDDAKLYSPNLSGSSTALKQTTWEGTRVNWVIVLTRGVVHVEAMPDGWKVNGPGLAAFVRRLPDILRRMLGADTPLPRVLFTDRGTGMYTSGGRVVKDYKAAVHQTGFRVFWGDDATTQSPDMGDVLLHETAVAWFRKRMRKEKPHGVPWKETPHAWEMRARLALQHINEHFQVAALCREFPGRLRTLVDCDGERLRK